MTQAASARLSGGKPQFSGATLPRVRTVGVEITSLRFKEYIATICEWASREARSRVICIANVHMVVEARRRVWFHKILRDADLVTPDGMPLVWMMRLGGARDQKRVAGMDLLPALCGAAERRSISVFFLGATEEVLSAIRTRLQTERPGLRIAGMKSLPFRPLTEEEDRQLVVDVNRSGAGILLIALGCPKQEIWMNQHRNRINAVMIGLGAAFAVYAGVQRRAPRFMRITGTEWLFRLATEPRRLWRRYLVTNTAFCWYALIDLLRKAISPRGIGDSATT